jgi:hypothetical protein
LYLEWAFLNIKWRPWLLASSLHTKEEVLDVCGYFRIV